MITRDIESQLSTRPRDGRYKGNPLLQRHYMPWKTVYGAAAYGLYRGYVGYKGVQKSVVKSYGKSMNYRKRKRLFGPKSRLALTYGQSHPDEAPMDLGEAYNAVLAGSRLRSDRNMFGSGYRVSRRRRKRFRGKKRRRGSFKKKVSGIVKYSMKKKRMRRRRNYIRKLIANAPSYGRVLRQCRVEQDIIGCSDNKSALHYHTIGTFTQLNQLMDDEYIIKGQTDALVTRDETYNLSYQTIGDKGQFKLLYKGVLVWKLKNNYNYSVQCVVYYLVSKLNQATDPKSAVESGLDNITDTADPEQDICYYPRHSDEFRRRWKVVKMKSFTMISGAETALRLSTGWRVFNPRVPGVEGNTTPYMTGHSRSIMIRMQGSIGNNEAGGQVGYTGGKLDTIYERHFKFRHIGQHQVKRYKASNNLSAVTNFMNVQQDHAAGNNPVDNQ